MEWVIAVISVLFILFALLLIFGGAGNPIQPGKRRGKPAKPMPPSTELLPAYYDEEANKFQTELSQANSASSLDEAIRMYHQLRRHNSAIIELNLAKLSLDKLEQDGSFLSPEEHQNSRIYISRVISRAAWLIKDKPDRYPMNIGDYLQSLQKRLG